MGTLIAASNPGAANACLDNGTNFGIFVDGGYNVSTDPTSPLNNGRDGRRTGADSERRSSRATTPPWRGPCSEL